MKVTRMPGANAIANVRGEAKDKTAESLTKLRLFYKEGQKVAALTQVAHVVKLRWMVTELEEVPEEKELQLHTLPSLPEGNTTLRSKVERMRTATSPLQSGSNVVFIVMDEIRALRDKKRP